MKHSITYLQGKMANKSPPPQVLSAHVAKLLGNVIRFHGGHHRSNTQGTKGCTDPHTGGPTAKTNKIIYDAIYASLPDDCKLNFAQMFCNFDDLCPVKAPLYVNGKTMISIRKSSIFSPSWNVLNGGTSVLTI